MILVPMTTAESVHVRQALDFARSTGGRVFDAEQREVLAEVEGRIGSHLYDAPGAGNDVHEGVLGVTGPLGQPHPVLRCDDGSTVAWVEGSRVRVQCLDHP